MWRDKFITEHQRLVRVSNAFFHISNRSVPQVQGVPTCIALFNFITYMTKSFVVVTLLWNNPANTIRFIHFSTVTINTVPFLTFC